MVYTTGKNGDVGDCLFLLYPRGHGKMAERIPKDREFLGKDMTMSAAKMFFWRQSQVATTMSSNWDGYMLRLFLPVGVNLSFLFFGLHVSKQATYIIRFEPPYQSMEPETAKRIRIQNHVSLLEGKWRLFKQCQAMNTNHKADVFFYSKTVPQMPTDGIVSRDDT